MTKIIITAEIELHITIEKKRRYRPIAHVFLQY